MNSRLQQLYSHLEEDRTELLEMVKGLSPEELNHSRNGKWSIQEILAHLIAAERLSIQYLNKKYWEFMRPETPGFGKKSK